MTEPSPRASSSTPPRLQIYQPGERLIVRVADLALAPLRWWPVGAPRQVERVLLLRLERIGDLLMTLDAIGAARQAWPDAVIDLAVGSWNLPLARLIPGISDVLVADAPWLVRGDGRASWPALLQAARTWRARRYDIVVNFEPDIRTNLLARISGAPVRVGYNSGGGGALLTNAAPYDPAAHVATNAAHAIARASQQPVSAEETPRRRTLRVPADAIDRARQFLGPINGPIVGVHASGGRESKQWHLDRFAAVARRLATDRGATIVLTGTAADRPLVNEVASRLDGIRVHSAVDRFDLPGLAALLGELDLFITGDTGPMHLAAAMHTPVVGLFGPSDPARYGPRAPLERIVRVDLPVQSVWPGSPATPALPWPRAGLHGRHRCRGRRRARDRDPGYSWPSRGAPLVDGHLTCIGRHGAQIDMPLSACLTAAQHDQVRADANRWIKDLRRAPFDGTSMRGRFTYRDDSLWWFTELYLHKMRQLDTAIGAVLALEAARDQHAPGRMRIATHDPAIRTAALAFAARTGLPVEISGPAPSARRASWNSVLVGLTAHVSRLRPIPRRPALAEGRIAAFVHTAFWRAGAAEDTPNQEHYIGSVLAALAGRVGANTLNCVGVGPRRHFRGRRWWDPITAAGAGPRIVPIEQLAPRSRLRGAFEIWRRRNDLARDIVAGADIRAAGIVRGYDLWPVLKHELEEVARVQWPWSARAMDEAAAALDALAPPVVVTYAEAGGWGRALMLEARRRAIPSVGLQHGFIYRHWLNYRHEPDEVQAQGPDRGFPRPDLTLVFDGYAASYLASAGQLPRATLAVTGSPRLDELASRVRAMTPERERLRREFGVATPGALVVLAAKFTEIHEELPSVLAAVSALPSVQLVIKTHPAESADGYRRLAASAPNVRVVESEADLGVLLAAADALVTMNSTVALDALVLGIPALVIGLPNNLSPFVEANVMVGADRGSVLPSLRTLLYDLDTRQQLRLRAAAYAAAHQMSSDGQAAARAADAILALAGR